MINYVKSLNIDSRHQKTMKVIFLKCLGPAKLAIGFLLTCSTFLILTLLEKPAQILNTARDNQYLFPSLGLYDEGSYRGVFLTDPSCQNDLLLTVVVLSTPRNFNKRKAIRDTWGRSKVSAIGLNHQILFLVGKPSQNDQSRLQKELQTHEDILSVNFNDTLKSESKKVMLGLKWIENNCQTSYILKTDDDSFVNMHLIKHFLHKHNRVKWDLYVGRAIMPSFVERNPKNVNYVPYSVYPQKAFPLHASYSYIISSDVLKKLVDKAKEVEIFSPSDPYIGVLASEIDVPFKDSARFAMDSTKWRICNYLYLFTVYRVTPEKQYLCMKYAEECYDKCEGQKEVTDWE